MGVGRRLGGKKDLSMDKLVRGFVGGCRRVRIQARDEKEGPGCIFWGEWVLSGHEADGGSQVVSGVTGGFRLRKQRGIQLTDI